MMFLLRIVTSLVAGALILSGVPEPSAARADAPITFSRTQIRVVTAHSSSAQETVQNGPVLNQSAARAHVFDVELRRMSAMRQQEGWFSLSGIPENRGVLAMLETPDREPITPVMQYSPLDILLVTEDGTIAQILPSLVLADLEEVIFPETSVLAMLYLRGGTCEQFGIAPGDGVQHAMFKKKPVKLVRKPGAHETTLPAQAKQTPAPHSALSNPSDVVAPQNVRQDTRTRRAPDAQLRSNPL